MSGSDFVTLTCPNCGGKLNITKDIDRFSCAHCGTEYIVKRGSGVVSLKPVLEDVSKGVGSTASELALVRLEKEIPEVRDMLERVKERVKGIEDQKQTRSTGKIIGVIGVALVIVGVLLLILFENISSSILVLGIFLLVAGFVMRFGFTESVKPWKEKEEKLSKRLSDLEDQRQYHYKRVNDV